MSNTNQKNEMKNYIATKGSRIAHVTARDIAEAYTEARKALKIKHATIAVRLA